MDANEIIERIRTAEKKRAAVWKRVLSALSALRQPFLCFIPSL